MIKAVTFDWWFTITNMPVPAEEFSEKAKKYRLAGMRKVLGDHGLDVGDERLSTAYDRLTKHLEEVWRRDLDVIGEEQIAVFLQYAGIRKAPDDGLIAKLGVPYRNAVLDYPPDLNPGIADCLATLRKDGYRLGIISNTGRTWGKALIELQKRYGIWGSFDVMSFSDEIGVRKPNPAIFKKTLEGLRLPAEQVLHVGDNTIDDVHGAKAVGMKAVWYDVGVRPGEKTDEADAIIHHFSELPAVVRRL